MFGIVGFDWKKRKFEMKRKLILRVRRIRKRILMRLSKRVALSIVFYLSI